jgi:hypothetical protein
MKTLKKISLFTFLASITVLHLNAQNCEHKISYEFNFKNEDKRNVHSTFENADLVQFEKLYFKCIEASIKNPSKQLEYFKAFNGFFLTFEKDNSYNEFFSRNGDTISYNFMKDFSSSVYVKEQFIVSTSKPKLDKDGYEVYSDYGDIIYEDQQTLHKLSEVSNAILFDEKWAVNSEGKFIKNVSGIAFHDVDIENESLEMPSVFVTSDSKNNQLFLKNVVYDVLFNEPSNEKTYMNYLHIDAKKDLVFPIFENFLLKI